MQFKPSPLSISDESPFEEDKLGRKEYLELLTPFILKLSAPFVVGMNAPWGSGKTTLLHMWRKKLESPENKRVVIYFNAWETDFTNSPLLAFVGEITKALEQLPGRNKKINTLIKNTKSIASSIVRHGAPAVIKAATLGLLDVDKAIEGVIADAAGEGTSDLVDNYLDVTDKIKEFHNNLQDAFEWATNNGKLSPIVIFVDELDRCRPMYAIELLENIKHLFTTKNAIFILAVLCL